MLVAMILDEYIQAVQQLHPEFSETEIQELCESYLAQFSAKTKPETKEKSLKKFLTREFGVQRKQPETDTYQVQSAFSSLPKSLFQYTNKKAADYIITIKNLTKQIWQTDLFDDAELRIKPDDKIALIGKNGVGKSTFLKMLIDPTQIDHWDVEILKWTTIGYLSQDLFWASRDRKVIDEMMTSLPDVTRNYERLEQIKELLSSWSGDSIALIHEQTDLLDWMLLHDAYQKYDLQKNILQYFWFTKEQLEFTVSQLSWWEQTKVQIAKFLLQDVDVLILDEPTNHLDIEGIMFLEQFCQSWWKALICISHDKRFISSTFSKVVEIDHKKLNLYYGWYDDFLEQKQKNTELYMKNYMTQQKYLAQQERFIERFRYKASKASQVQSRIKMLDKIDRIDAPEQQSTAHGVALEVKRRLPETLIKLSDLQVWYDQPLVTLPRNLEVHKQDKIGIIWKNWVGKTTLLKTLLGILPALQGSVWIHDKVTIWFYSQVAEELDYDATIQEELAGPWVNFKDIMAILGALLIPVEKATQKIATLSWGERSKVALCKMLLSQPDIIVMDEPTNHLDLYSKDAVKDMLAWFNGVSIIVSHDRDFLQSTSDLLWVVKNKELTVFHSMDRGFDEIMK